MKILCVGNCQVTPIADIISAVEPDFDCHALEVWKASEEECKEIDLTTYDAIIAQPLFSNRYGLLTYDRLVEHCKGKPLLFIHNLHFEGILPDCTYVGPLGKRITGPMGTYHSSIVRHGFLSGASIIECTALLNSGATIDVQKIWSTAVDTLAEREQNVTVPFLEELLFYLKTHRCFHVFNHPNSFLLERYTEKILSVLLDRSNCTLNIGRPDALARGGTWPIYDWLADALDLPYGRNGYIIPKISSERMSHREFVELSYKAYSRAAPGRQV